MRRSILLLFCQNGFNLSCFLLGGHDLSKPKLSVKYKVCHANEIYPCFNLKVIIVGAFTCSGMQKGELLLIAYLFLLSTRKRLKVNVNILALTTVCSNYIRHTHSPPPPQVFGIRTIVEVICASSFSKRI